MTLPSLAPNFKRGQWRVPMSQRAHMTKNWCLLEAKRQAARSGQPKDQHSETPLRVATSTATRSTNALYRLLNEVNAHCNRDRSNPISALLSNGTVEGGGYTCEASRFERSRMKSASNFLFASAALQSRRIREANGVLDCLEEGYQSTQASAHTGG
jgi:hypothetical protein